MRSHIILLAFVTSLCAFSGTALAGDVPARDGPIARWMIKQESVWANMACGGKWIALNILADDPNTKWSTDCRMESADVRFFSPDVAVVYGTESKKVALEDPTRQMRCLVWTDTWLKRNGKWQIIAAQDGRVECHAK